MTSSFMDGMLQKQPTAPTEEVVKEEVIVVKEASTDNLIFQMVELASYLYHLNLQAHLIHLNLEAPYFLAVHKFLKKQYQNQSDCNLSKVYFSAGELMSAPAKWEFRLGLPASDFTVGDDFSWVHIEIIKTCKKQCWYTKKLKKQF